ncbi:hypothetical protein IR150_16820 [Providencia alcalifaciens]|uniref:beta-ketoacyl synthase N-terminal-like domain-containing protein n=1 Tax=Providencia alcalifaciens TaxID=126385 RepID=UPI0015CF912A|nr:beta-ketoacyl synthase N-terminal-like domain-containing protein [Providencia alcalifaciens]MBF0693138.1 hypothetical protein [Providencia alcalifaciens]NYS91642.1 hypothetical protein [Providencia alcalifaciens]
MPDSCIISVSVNDKGVPVTACAASIQSIGDGLRIIKSGEASVAVVGGSEACINSTSLGSYHFIFCFKRALRLFFIDLISVDLRLVGF